MVFHQRVAVSSPDAYGPHASPYARLVDTRPWYKNKRLLALNAWIALLLVTSSTNGFDASMMNGLQSLVQWENEFQYPSGGKLGLLSAMQNVGSLCALPAAPWLADAYGRRWSIFIGAGIMILGATLQAGSQSIDMFTGARFLLGFGLTFSINAAPLLVIELAYPTQRAPLTSLYNTFWFLGSIVASWSTFASFHLATSWSWRIPSSLQALPSILQFFLIWFVPESPRWLVAQGRRAEALRTLAHYHAQGNEEDPLVEYEYEEIKTAIAVEKALTDTTGWMCLWKTRGNRKRLRIIVALAFFSQWSGNGLLSYYLSKVLNSVEIRDSRSQLLINGSLGILSLLCAVSAGLLCERIGRRKLFITSISAMLLFWSVLTASLALYGHDDNRAPAVAVVVSIFLFTISYAIAFTPLIVSYTLEILPFALRAKGFAVFSFSISVSVIFNQYVNPIALTKLTWKYYLIYTFWLLFELLFVFVYLIETKGKTLEETSALFDGGDSVADIAYRATIHAGLDSAFNASAQSEPSYELEHDTQHRAYDEKRTSGISKSSSYHDGNISKTKYFV